MKELSRLWPWAVECGRRSDKTEEQWKKQEESISRCDWIISTIQYFLPILYIYSHTCNYQFQCPYVYKYLCYDVLDEISPPHLLKILSVFFFFFFEFFICLKNVITHVWCYGDNPPNVYCFERIMMQWFCTWLYFSILCKVVFLKFNFLYFLILFLIYIIPFESWQLYVNHILTIVFFEIVTCVEKNKRVYTNLLDPIIFKNIIHYNM